MLDFRLYTFLTLSDTLNYTKAAEQLCISQPAVSQHIRYLETTYEVKLFDHSGKQLALTKQGAYLAQCVRTIAADEKRMMTTLKNIKESTTLRFGATLTIGEYILPEKISQYLKLHPDTSLSMVVENTALLLDMLDHGEISFALVEGYFSNTSYAHQTIATQPFIAVKAATYQCKKPIHTLTDLLEEPIILREQGSGTREILERVLKEQNLTIHDFHNAIEIGNINAIKHLIENNLGISFLYEAAVEEELKKGSLTKIPLADFLVNRDLTFVTLKDTIFMNEYQEFLACFF